MQISCLSLYFLLYVLASIDGACLQELLLWNMPTSDFLFPFFLLYPFINWNSSVRKSCSFSAVGLFTYLFISVLAHGYLFYSMVESNVIVIYFVAQMVSALLWGALSGWLLCPLDTPNHCVFWALPYCLAPQDVPGSSVFSLFQTWNQPPLQEIPVYFIGERYFEPRFKH